MLFAINPGTGPVRGSDEENAEVNIRVFAEDLEIPGVNIHRESESDLDGRFGFVLELNGKRVSIDMPGIPLENVRFLGLPSQNIWNFPRLYVDGSSWVWMFALNAVKLSYNRA